MSRAHRLALVLRHLVVALILAGQALAAEPQNSEAADRSRMVGRVTKAQGEVIAVGERGRLLKVGTRVFEKDELHTGRTGRVEIQFVDESTLILGAETIFKLDQFVFHPSVDNVSMELSLLKGVFRLVTSRLGFARPTDLRVETPVATIGIRGTDFWGGFLKPGELDVLLVSGKNLTVSNQAGAQTLVRPGYGLTVTSAHAAPGKPLQWKQDKVARAFKSVAFE
jgi:hypothetical protein